jgi:hypothetical protein
MSSFTTAVMNPLVRSGPVLVRAMMRLCDYATDGNNQGAARQKNIGG